MTTHSSILAWEVLWTEELGRLQSMEMQQRQTQLWRRWWHPTPVLLPGKSHGWRSLVGCSPWGLKESDTTERLHFHFLKMWPSGTQTDSCLGQRLASVQSHIMSDVGIQVKDNRYKEWLHFLCAKYSCSFLVAGWCFPFPILRNSLSPVKIRWWITETPQGENCAPWTPVTRTTRAVPAE